MRTSIAILVLFCFILPTSARPGGRCTSDQDCPSSNPLCSQSGTCQSWGQGQVGGGAPAPSSSAPPSPTSPRFRASKTTSASSIEPSYTLPLTDQELSLGYALQEALLQSDPLQKLFRNIVKAKLLPAVRSGCIRLRQLRRRINKPGEFERLLGKLLHLEEIHYKCWNPATSPATSPLVASSPPGIFNFNHKASSMGCPSLPFM